MYFPRNWFKLMVSPVVLGSAKSGADSPTSTAGATPGTINTLAIVTPTSTRPLRYLTAIRRICPPPCFTGQGHSPERCCVPLLLPRHRAPSAHDTIGLKQDLRGDRQPQGLCRLQIDDKLDVRIHLYTRSSSFFRLTVRAC